MQIEKSDMLELAGIISKAVIDELEKRGIVESANPKVKSEKTAYQKTEQLLYNYMGFKRVVEERQLEIEELKKYGVPKQSPGTMERVQHSNVHGIVLEEDSVRGAIASVQRSVDETVQAISMIDKCMKALEGDPYYCILEMRYFEGRTQEDIATHLGVSQVSVSKNKNRLVRELSMRLFPNQVIQEMIK